MKIHDVGDKGRHTLLCSSRRAPAEDLLILKPQLVAHWFTDFISDSPSQINFMIFCAVWTILAAIYLLIATLKFTDSIIGHGFILLAVDAITMIFWFAGFIALAVGVGGLSCNGNSVCGSADASAAFGAFEW